MNVCDTLMSHIRFSSANVANVALCLEVIGTTAWLDV